MIRALSARDASRIYTDRKLAGWERKCIIPKEKSKGEGPSFADEAGFDNEPVKPRFKMFFYCFAREPFVSDAID